MGILHDHGHVAVPKNPLKRMDATPIHHVVTGEGVPKNLGELLRNGLKGQGRRLEYSAPCHQDLKGCDASRDPFYWLNTSCLHRGRGVRVNANKLRIDSLFYFAALDRQHQSALNVGVPQLFRHV